MSFKSDLKLSSLAIAVVALACLSIDWSLKNWEKEDRVIEWDVHSYYEYLPAYFIYDDIKFEKSDYHLGDGRYLFWPVYTDDGRKVIKMSMGTAFFYAPFFFAAHAYASVTDYPEDGFSVPYKIFLLLSTVFFLIIGLDFLRKILAHFNFSDKIIATVILLIGLGTNMLCYASHSAPMSHIYSFCAFCVFIYYTIRWYEEQSIKNTVVLGLVFGLISLVRPTNAAIILFFILYGISTLPELKERVLFLSKKYFILTVMVLCTLLVWTPQIIYWKHVTGDFLSYSYGDEGFFFSHPKILEGLFSWRKGWLVYTPMIAFALMGIYFLRGELRKLRLPIIVFMAVNIYIIFSWWCWWYGGTLGQRSFIESYGLLAIPLASFIKFLSEKKWYYNAPFYLIAAFFIWLNIFQTYQFEFHSLHHEGMSRGIYFKQFGKMDKVEGFDSMIHWPNYDAAKKGNNCDTRSSEESTPIRPLQSIHVSDKKEVSRKTIHLKASNGKYVCADENLNNALIANRDSAQGWETFTLIEFENKEYAILSHKNKFFTVEKQEGDQIFADRENMSKLGTFSIVDIDKGHIAFKAANGHFLSTDEKSFQLFATGKSTGKNEKFEIVMK